MTRGYRRDAVCDCIKNFSLSTALTAMDQKLQKNDKNVILPTIASPKCQC